MVYRHLRIIEVLPANSASAAGAALLFLSACATTGAQSQGDVASLRTEVRTLQKENAELAQRVEAMAAQVDILSARLARAEGPRPPAERPAAAAPAPVAGPMATPSSRAAPVAKEAAPVVPSNLKVVKLEPSKGSPPARSDRADSAAPALPVSTPIQEPTAAALASLARSGKPASTDAQASWDRARALSGLARARSMEQLADDFPSSPRAGEALVDAARTRQAAGDPDGACEDFTRAVAEYPGSRAAPDALEGLAACELHRGRSAEASRLAARLAKDFPDSPAGKRASEHAPTVQGAAP